MVKGDKKIIRGWVFYDWANSVYNLVISSAIFPIFYNAQTTAHYLQQKSERTGILYTELGENENVLVDFFGSQISSSVLFSYVLSASFLFVAILSPILSGVADYSGNKKRFLQFFCYFGSISAMSLFFFDTNHMEWSMLSVFFASVGFWNSLVFYNAYLPEIAEPKDHDKISAKGFTMGYFGSMLLLIICLGIVMGIGKEYTRYCFILVGLWWAGFSQITYAALPNNVFNRKPQKGIIVKGFKELLGVLKSFSHNKELKQYLYSFFFFNTGVQTVMLMATIFASKEIDWPDGGDTSGLIIAILLIQILGAVGAFLMSRLSQRIGNIKTLMISIFIWLVICFMAYYVVHKPFEFYIMAALVGLVMGGVQSVARSTYSKLLPETEDHASYFSFYDVTEKIGIVVGTFFFGFVEYLFDSIRFSVISIAIFFLIGFVLLFFVPKTDKLLK